MFLNFFIRKAVYDQKVYLEKHDTLQILSPTPSSWGYAAAISGRESIAFPSQ
jgi:hypothetical protein